MSHNVPTHIPKLEDATAHPYVRVLGITGKKGSGKTTSASLISQHIQRHYHRTVHLISFADPLKQILELCYLPASEYQTQSDKEFKPTPYKLSYRQSMMAVADSLKETIDPLILTKIGYKKYLDMIDQYQPHRSQPLYIIFTDIRFSHEVELLSRLSPTAPILNPFLPHHKQPTYLTDQHNSEQLDLTDYPHLPYCALVNTKDSRYHNQLINFIEENYIYRA